MQNCLFEHDFLSKNLPECFDGYFQKLNDIYTENTAHTVNHELGCLFTPYRSTVRYGLCSVTRKCIDSWNFFTKELKTDLSKINRTELKTKILRCFNVDKRNNHDNRTDNNTNRNCNRNNNNRNNDYNHGIYQGWRTRGIGNLRWDQN